MINCSQCREWKPSADYYKDNTTSSGYKCYCKTCLKAKRAAEYRENRDYIISRQKQYYANNIEARRAYQRDYDAKQRGMNNE